MSRPKSTLQKLSLAISSIIVALLLMEGVVRVLDIPPKPLDPLPIPSYRLSDDPIIAYEFRPDYHPDQQQFDFGHLGYAINHDGFRDYNYPKTKPTRTYRIIMLGDSTTAGNGIQKLENTYPKLLERELNSDPKRKRRYEVLNMGVGGYHTMQEAQTLKVKGLRYHPDMVFILVCLNDFVMHFDAGLYQQLAKVNAGSYRPAENPVSRWFLKHSRLAFVLYHRLHKVPLDSDDWYVKNALKGKSTVRAGFELFSELQQENGFIARVLILPDFTFPFNDYRASEIHDRVKKAAEDLSNIPVTDLREQFQSVDMDARKFSFDGCHMNEYGHSVITRFISKMIPRN